MEVDDLVVTGSLKSLRSADMQSVETEEVNGVSSDEISQLSGLSGNVQEQLDEAYEIISQSITEFENHLSESDTKLNKFGEDEDGNLTYNGQLIKGGGDLVNILTDVTSASIDDGYDGKMLIYWSSDVTSCEVSVKLNDVEIQKLVIDSLNCKNQFAVMDCQTSSDTNLLAITTTPETPITVVYPISLPGSYLTNGYVVSISRFKLSGTIASGNTSISFSDIRIKSDSLIEIFTSEYGISASSITVDAGSITIEFEATENDLDVDVVVTNDVSMGVITNASTDSIYEKLDTLDAVIANSSQGKIVDAVAIKEFINSKINTESGVHGIRFYNGKLSYYDNESEEWVDIETGGGGAALAIPTSVSFTNKDEAVVIKWTDPIDVTLDGAMIAKWGGTLVVRKAGSAPTSKTDGVIVVDSKTRNQYSSTGFEDSGLTNGVTYYYGIFPYTTSEVYTYDYTGSITPSAIYPGAATNVSASVGDAQVTITFTIPSTASYARIVYKTETAPTSPTDGTSTNNVTSPYTITGLINDTIYYAKVYTYNAKGRSTGSETISFEPTDFKIVSFASGTDTEITKMIEAHYKGIINISDYWAVGDTRDISLNGTSYAFAIMDFDNHDLVTSINGISKAAVTIGMVNCYNTAYAMHSSNDNTVSWENCSMRTTMGTMKSYLPTDIQNIIKQVKIKTNSGGTDDPSLSIIETYDYCFLPSYVELSGNTSTPYVSEGTQFDYYKTSSNLIKTRNGSDTTWWIRTPYAGDSKYYYYIDATGAYHRYGGTGAAEYRGVSFCFCV